MRFREKFARFMAGRYGSDQLNRFLMIVALVCVVLNSILGKNAILSILVLGLLILTYLRMLSRNIQARYNENTRYLQLKEKILSKLNLRSRGNSGGNSGYGSSANPRSNAKRSDAEHRIFRCPGCQQKVRVPRGRGKLLITCPKCGREFTRRS